MADDRLPVECVINISEGREHDTIVAVAAPAGSTLVDLHTDAEHNRSVLPLAGSLADVEPAARGVAAATVSLVDLTHHAGAHPRLGSLDVVPFVALPAPGHTRAPTPAVRSVRGARDRFARWAGDELGLPCFLYGPERSLPEVRRAAFVTLAPSTGPTQPHPTAGAAAVGVRPVLIAYNVWIEGPPGSDPARRRASALAAAKEVAARVRGRQVRSLGLPVGPGAQVSLNLIDPETVPPDRVYDRVAQGGEALGCTVLRAELVGLLPLGVLEAVPRHRWPELDLAEDRTIEARLRSVSGGSRFR